VGDRVVNTNPGCKHHRSEGNVIGVDELPDEMGKVVSYRVTNAGPTYRLGDVLRKTMDQVSPIHYEEEDEYSRPDYEGGEDRGLAAREYTIMPDDDEYVSTRDIMREWFSGRLDRILKD
jgi:hypothetical protein